MAERFGRDPGDLQLVVRADPRIDARPGGRHRPAFTGSCTEVTHDVERVREIGATEVILDFNASANSVDELVESAQCLSGPMLAVA